MKLFVLIVGLFVSFLSRADAWDNLSYDEAQQVVAELERNPFIFDYCDCCGNNLNLVKVLTTEIIPCSWQEGQFSVRYTFLPIASFDRDSEQGELRNPQTYAPEEGVQILYMNYTWTLDPETGKAASFFRAVPYDYYENQMCAAPFAYPTPKMLKSKAKKTGYKAWYNTHIKAA